MIPRAAPAGWEAWSTGLNRPEAVAVGLNGVAYAGGAGGELYRIERDGTSSIVAETGGWLLGLAIDAAGWVYACDCDLRKILRIDPMTGSVAVYSDSTDAGDWQVPNYCAFFENGDLLVSDSEGQNGEPGRLLTVPAGGGTARSIDLPPLQYPNGVAFDGDDIIVVESHAQRVVRFASGELTTVGHLPDCYPDGVAIADDGRVIVSSYQPNVIHVIGKGGDIEVLASDPSGMFMLSPTNIAFDPLVPGRVLVASLLGWGVGALTIGILGRPLNYPEWS
ncbi:MAG: SMP-30/gluconolactonase/LRE family protein [Acidimicrobiia bacterium]|nr:SMP-30/gluconolactonase/LRE family protein [Acidimicrobiia bacterium]